MAFPNSTAPKGLGALQAAEQKAKSDSNAPNAQDQAANKDTPQDTETGGPTTNPAQNPDSRAADSKLNETKPLSAAPDPVVGNQQSESVFDKAQKIYTSAPVQRLKIGRFQFERATLTLTESEDVAEFEKILEKLPAYDRNRIKTISVENAEAMVRPIEPGVTQQFDSSVGRHREKSATGDAIVGEQPLGSQPESFSKQAQTDNNAPVDGVNVIPPGASQTESKND